jgi:hypothetical protein
VTTYRKRPEMVTETFEGVQYFPDQPGHDTRAIKKLGIRVEDVATGGEGYAPHVGIANGYWHRLVPGEVVFKDGREIRVLKNEDFTRIYEQVSV